VLAGDDQPAPGARYALHRRYLVPVAAIELDEFILSWVRRWFPDDAAEPKAGYQGTIYPVVERDARLVLLAGFATFAALREAGAEWVTAYTLPAATERELLELAAVLAMSSGS
jgi:hypothetical protein